MPFIDNNTESQSDQENDQPDQLIYQLYAVVVHLGEAANNGHIFSYVRSPDELWYKINDELVTPVNIETVLSDKNSYILYYAKLSEDKISLYQTKINELSTRPSCLSSSTPVRRAGKTSDHFADCSPISTKSISDIYNFDNEFPQQISKATCFISDEQSPMTNEDVACSHSSSEEDSILQMKSFSPQNTFDSIEYQTESRIEVIRRNNHTDQYSNYSSTSDTSRSYSSSQLIQTPLINRRNISFENDSHQSYNKVTRLSQHSITNIDPQVNILNESLEEQDDFHIQLSSSHNSKLQSADLLKLQSIRTKKNNKKQALLFQEMGLPIDIVKTTNKKKICLSKTTQPKTTINQLHKNSDNSYDSNQEQESKVDVEYLYILLPYIKQFNKYCALCVRNCTFGQTTKDGNQLLRCMLYCSGRPVCPFSCSIIVFNNGNYNILVNETTVRHTRGVKLARPIRKPLRSILKQQFKNGATVYRAYQERMQKRTVEEKNGNNYDTVGKSRQIFRKIKSEGVAESLLAADVNDSLSKLYKKYRNEVNIDGKIKGAIQQISRHPCQLIVFTESSIRLFDRLVHQKNVVLSWDATGSVIQEKNDSIRLLYYELTITLPGIVSEDGLIPITFMISDAHSLVDIIHWMELFKHSYSQVFVGKTFPRPKIILSDRAQVFLSAALQIFNNESMKDFLNRAFRIVNGHVINQDYELTNIHACIAHVLIDARKTINKYLPEQFRELAMWSIALLVNSSTWTEFKHNWKLICLVFLQLHLGEEHIDQVHQDNLLDKICKIKSDSDIFNAVKSSNYNENVNTTQSYNQDVYDYCENDDDDIDDIDEDIRFSKSTRKKIIIDEEQEVNTTDSKFKSAINEIFHNALLDTGMSQVDVNGNSSGGILRWFNYLVKYFMPTAAIWSNMLLGDLTRHRRRLVRSYERLNICQYEQRTTAISERRMCILKRTQLGGRIHIRLDVLLSIIIPDMLVLIDEFSNALMSYSVTSQVNSNNSSLILEERQLKPIEERWRQTTSKRGQGRYSKSPQELVVTDLISSLLSSRANVNGDLKLPNLSPHWLNVAIGLLLSTGNNAIDRYTHSSSSSLTLLNASPLLDVITNYIKEWYSSTSSGTRPTTITLSSSTMNELNIFQQSTFILEKILIPLLPCHIIVNKVYSCISCESVMRLNTTITSISINVLRTGLQLEHDLYSFFSSSPSDIACTSCKRTTTRHIEVLQWPEVLILNINESQRNVKFRKPPGVLSLTQFSTWFAVGLLSSAVYDLVCFNSIIQSGANSLMVRTTKVKQSWSTSINKRLIRDGDQIKRLFAHSRILVFQRLQNHIKSNFLQAIIKCALDTSTTSFNNIPTCSTIQEACSIIQTNYEFDELNDALISNIKSYFYCNSCRGTSNAFSSSSNQVFLFKQNTNNQLFGYPVVFNNSNKNNNKQICPSCKNSTGDIEMDIHKQVFLQCPACLITFIDPKVGPHNVFNANISLYDVHNTLYNYIPTTLFFISAYSDSLTLVKQEHGDYIQFIGDLFSEHISLSFDKLLDIFDTSASILVFHHQVFIAGVNINHKI